MKWVSLKNFLVGKMIQRMKQQIEKQYIFVQLDLEHYYEPFYDRDLSQTSCRFEKPEYMDLHKSFN